MSRTRGVLGLAALWSALAIGPAHHSDAEVFFGSMGSAEALLRIVGVDGETYHVDVLLEVVKPINDARRVELTVSVAACEDGDCDETTYLVPTRDEDVVFREDASLVAVKTRFAGVAMAVSWRAEPRPWTPTEPTRYPIPGRRWYIPRGAESRGYTSGPTTIVASLLSVRDCHAPGRSTYYHFAGGDRPPATGERNPTSQLRPFRPTTRGRPRCVAPGSR